MSRQPRGLKEVEGNRALTTKGGLAASKEAGLTVSPSDPPWPQGQSEAAAAPGAELVGASDLGGKAEVAPRSSSG